MNGGSYKMREVGKFITTTKRADIDPQGSTADLIFAEAVQASMPMLVVDKYNMVMKKDVPGQVDSMVFPVFKNFDLTWTDITGTGSDLGSELTLTQGGAMEYAKLTPVLYTAGIFVTDAVDLKVNKASFDQYANLAAVQVSKKIDIDVIKQGFLNIEGTASTYSAGGLFGVNGSVTTGSTLCPLDLINGYQQLETGGAENYPPDAVLMHPIQHNQLIGHQDMSPSSTTGYYRKAKFDADGNLVKFNGMDIIKTDLVDTGSGSGNVAAHIKEWAVAGNPVVFFKKGVSVALATKNAGFKVNSVDDRLRHGTYKVFDVMFDTKYILADSMLFMRASNA